MRTPSLFSLSLLLTAPLFTACEASEGEEEPTNEGEGEEGEGEEGEGEEGEGEEGEGEGEEGEGEDVLDVVAYTEDATIAAGVYLVDDDVSVSEGATLTVEAGTTLRFTPGHELLVAGGTLIARGTADAEIVIEADDDGRGAFGGVQLLSDTGVGTVLEHVTIRGGGEAVNGMRGCLSISAAPRRSITLQDVTLEDCAVAGLGLDIGSTNNQENPFLVFDDLTVRRSDAGYFADAPLVTGIAETVVTEDTPHHRINAFTPPLTRGENVWVGQNVPVDVDGTVEIEEGPSLNVFSIEAFGAPLELRFDAGQWMRANGGTFLAFNTVFRGKTAGTGTWIGLVFSDDVRPGTVLDTVTIDGGGEENAFSFTGCLTVGDTERAVQLRNVTLKKCGVAGLGALGGPGFTATHVNVIVEDSPAGFVADLRAVDSIPTLQLVRTTTNHIVVDGQTLDTAAHWRAQPAPIEVDETIEVAGGTLTIDGGVTLQLHPQEQLVVTGGALNVAGTAGNRAVFQRAEANSAWIGIVIASGAPEGTVIAGARVTGAGADDFIGADLAGGISIDAGGVVVDDVEFADNANADITRGCNTNPTITNSTGTFRDSANCG